MAEMIFDVFEGFFIYVVEVPVVLAVVLLLLYVAYSLNLFRKE